MGEFTPTPPINLIAYFIAIWKTRYWKFESINDDKKNVFLFISVGLNYMPPEYCCSIFSHKRNIILYYAYNFNKSSYSGLQMWSLQHNKTKLHLKASYFPICFANILNYLYLFLFISVDLIHDYVRVSHIYTHYLVRNDLLDQKRRTLHVRWGIWNKKTNERIRAR